MAGRPTTYSAEVAEQAWRYLETFQDHGHAVPSVVGLCQVIKRPKSTVYDWAADPEKEFSDILSAINELQELVTFNKSLTGEYNATIAKLLLGKHGYHDKQDNTFSAPGGGPMQVEATIKLTAEESYKRMLNGSA